jgi:hypothetical protein
MKKNIITGINDDNEMKTGEMKGRKKYSNTLRALI